MLKEERRKIRGKFIKNGIVFALTLVFISSITINLVKKWNEKTVAKNSVLCNAYARRLLYTSESKIRNYNKDSLLISKEINPDDFIGLDTVLTKLTTGVLEKEQGLEGGFYFQAFDKFAGYAYPTSEPPKPIYGPPPRSYEIIRKQCLKCIDEQVSQIDLHGFDPAVFPLVTVPIRFKNDVIGAIWVRTHIERELPLEKLQNAINIALLLLILSLIIVLWFSYMLRMDIQSIQDDLEIVNQNPDYRLQKRGKLFTGIINSINKTLEQLNSENYQRRQLEYKLIQKEKMASIGRIVAGVAHEVRTPLAIIKTRLQMWQQDLKDNGIAEKGEHITEDAIKLVINEANRLSNLIKRLLMFSKPIDKKLQGINVNELFNEVIILLQEQTKESKYKFDIQKADVPEIEMDKNSMLQVLINIISNSMEAMPDGGKITINSHMNDENMLSVNIEDEGTGIPDDIIDKMFELFVTSKKTGVGLGLAISKEIIKAHKGDILFENLKTGGTKCIIKLPLMQQ